RTWSGYIFFFQAEDGIRDWSVTGVQTCALPIFRPAPFETRPAAAGQGAALPLVAGPLRAGDRGLLREPAVRQAAVHLAGADHREIGRASCRERVWSVVVGVVVRV